MASPLRVDPRLAGPVRVSRDARPTPRRRPHRLLHEIFEARTRAAPDAPAVESGGLTVSYDQLNRRANQLAHHLIGRGVGRGTRVALLLPRSIDACVAMLGILKTGAAYVPIDPECPHERAEFVLGDSGASAIVSTEALGSVFWGYGRALVRIDADHEDLLAESDEAPPPLEAASRDLCYILYTSGANGRPQGVMIEHRNAVHLVEAGAELFRVRPGDRVCQAASLACDSSVAEIWLALRSGATLVIAAPAAPPAGPELSHLLTHSRVTVLSCCPTMLETLDADAPTLRLLILRGEACPDELVARWARPWRRIVGIYGPIETAGIAAWQELLPGRPATLGRRVRGCQIHLLDPQLRATAPGGVGEIVIGGPGVARGYLNRPECTERCFVAPPDWLRDEPGDHLFRSGDLGRLLDRDGNIEIIGRLDSQVTLHGQRIELAEVECALLECDGVHSAACSVWEVAPGVRQLVAQVESLTGPVDESRLLAELRRHLPDYMVPSRIVTVPEASS